MPSSKTIKFGLIALVIILPVFGFYLFKSLQSPQRAEAETKPETGQIAGAKATFSIQKEVPIPVLDGRGKELTKLVFSLENAEKRDEIIVKGSKAKAVDGRTFLIVDLKIRNDYNQGLEIKSRDYFRLSVNGQEEWLAPDIHNDPVEVQAISTKYTRIGFPINDNDTNLVLQVGPIEGEKQKIELNF